MDTPLLLLFLISVASIVLGCSIVIYQYRQNTRWLRHQNRELQQRLQEAQEEREASIQEKATLQSEREYAHTRMAELETELQQAKAEQQEIRTHVHEMEKQRDLAQLKQKEIAQRMADWEKTQHDAILHAKSAVLEAGTQLSSQLLDMHKQESESHKKAQTSQFVEHTNQLQEKFQNLTRIISTLEHQVQESNSTVNVLQQALLTPSGAGNLAEISLENMLKSMHLIPGKDFIMQYHVSEDGSKSWRPDAILFLPANQIMVIDSKASKFFTDLAMAETDEEQKEIEQKLKQRMQQHLKALAAKNYKESIRQQIDNMSTPYTVEHIILIMFLPTEASLETLQSIDPTFMAKAWEQDIFPAGPTGLIHILAQSRYLITESQRSENHEHIMRELRKLLSATNTLHGHAHKLGNALQSAFGHYDKFAASFNGNLLTRAHQLEKLGATASSHRPLPSHLTRYQLVGTPDSTTIEGITSTSQSEETTTLEHQKIDS